MKEMGL